MGKSKRLTGAKVGSVIGGIVGFIVASQAVSDSPGSPGYGTIGMAFILGGAAVGGAVGASFDEFITSIKGWFR